MRRARWFGTVLLLVGAGGCAGAPLHKGEPSMAIRAAEEAGNRDARPLAVRWQLVKEPQAAATTLDKQAEEKQVRSLPPRVEADVELPVALFPGESDKLEAAKAVERERPLREDNPWRSLP